MVLDSAQVIYIIGITLSCISLYIFLAVLILSKKFRNLPGRNLLSLCIARIFVSLLSSYSFVQSECYKTKYIVKLMLYFAFCFFIWNVVIAYDTWRTLRISTTKCLVVSGSRWKRFLAYSILGWILPFFVSISSDTKLWMPMILYSYKTPDFSIVIADFTFHLFILIIISNVFFSSGSLYYIWKNNNSIRSVDASSGLNFIQNFGLPLRLLLFSGYFSLFQLLLLILRCSEAFFYFSTINAYQGILFTFLFTYRRNVIECIDVGKNSIKG